MDDVAGNVVALGRGGFFAVDKRAWAKACALGINAPIAYLVLARGSGGDNRTTSWSTNAIEERTNIPRHKAKAAIKALISAGLVRQDKGGSRPRYFIQPAHLIVGCEGFVSPPLTVEESALLDTMRRSRAKDKTIATSTEQTRQTARSLVGKGYAVEANATRDYSWFAAVDSSKITEAETPPEWIWIPNALVDGAAGETAPIELVRQAQQAAAIRLLIDLYHAQALQHHGGVHWQVIRECFERHKIGERGPFVVWGFRPTMREAWGSFAKPHLTGNTEQMDDGKGGKRNQDTGWPIFWAALKTLELTGLVQFVAHLIDADTDEGSVLHPYAIGNGEPGERAIAEAAHVAAGAMLTEEKLEMARLNRLSLAPIAKHLGEVQMVGLARLTYRARTTATAAWFDLSAWEGWVRHYERMAEEQAAGKTSSPAFATSRGDQG